MESLQVLIVEDESLVSQGLVLMLSQAGHTVAGVASDSETAMAEVAEKRPDIVLLDLEGPELDGIETTRRLMAENPVPIVVLAANAGNDIALQAAEAGAFGFLVKPISLSDLLPAIAIALKRFRDWSEASLGYNELKETLETRKFAEQAKGIIMQRLGLPEGQAYAHLREKCRNQQKTMKQASIEIIEADRQFMDQLSKEPPSRMRPRYSEERPIYAERT